MQRLVDFALLGSSMLCYLSFEAGLLDVGALGVSAVVVATLGVLANVWISHDVFAPRVIVPAAIVALYWLGFLLSEPGRHESVVARVMHLGYVGFLLGFLVSGSQLRLPPYVDLSRPRSSRINIALLLFWLLGAAGLVGIVLQVGIPVLRDDLQDYRISMQSEIRYFGLINLFYKCFIVYLYLAAIQLARGQVYWGARLMIASGVVVALLALASFGNRGLVVFPLITMIVVYHYLRHRLSIFVIVALGSLAVLVVTSIGYVRLSAGEIESLALLAWMIHELTVPSANLAVITALFPERQAFMLGQGILAPIVTFLPGKQYLLDWFLKDLSGMTFSGGGLPPTLFGLLYLDFGLVGVVAGAALLGMLLVRLWRWAQLDRNLMTVAIYAFAIELVVVSFRNSLTLDAFFFLTLSALLALRYVRLDVARSPWIR